MAALTSQEYVDAHSGGGGGGSGELKYKTYFSKNSSAITIGSTQTIDLSDIANIQALENKNYFVKLRVTINGSYTNSYTDARLLDQELGLMYTSGGYDNAIVDIKQGPEIIVPPGFSDNGDTFNYDITFITSGANLKLSKLKYFFGNLFSSVSMINILGYVYEVG